MKPAFNRIEPDLPHSDQVKSPPPVGRKRAFSFEIRRTSQPISVPTGRQNQELDPDLVADLPQFNHQNDSSDRQSPNPIVETNQTPAPLDVAACEAQLQRIVGQIEQLYFEGPIVAGWLESCTTTTDVVQQNLVEEQPASQVDDSSLDLKPEVATPHADYHLCGLDTAGQKWCYPCPVDQLPSASIAIARYQKLQQLLEHKQYFETCLKNIMNATD